MKVLNNKFNIEIAEKIYNKEIEGVIVPTKGKSVRILCWDSTISNNKYPIIALFKNSEGEEICIPLNNEGKGISGYGIEIIYSEYKDGDILVAFDDKPFIYLEEAPGNIYAYVGIYKDGLLHYADENPYSWCEFSDIKGRASKEQVELLKDALIKSESPYSSILLKKFFGITKFNFLQPVLVRNNNLDNWRYGEFVTIFNSKYTVSGGTDWEQCIAYVDDTKHLLGTNKEYK